MCLAQLLTHLPYISIMITQDHLLASISMLMSLFFAYFLIENHIPAVNSKRLSGLSISFPSELTISLILHLRCT